MVVIPEPVKPTVWGLPGASSAIVTEAVLLPSAVGVKVTLMLQVPLGARDEPHVLFSPKSPTLAPATLMELKFTGLKPVFETVMDCPALVFPTGSLPNPSVGTESCTTASPPLPESETLCGVPGALSVKEREALRVPFAVGAKLILIWQLAATATLPWQLLVSRKSPEFVPVIATFDKFSGPVPLFVSVRLCGELVVPSGCAANVRLAFERTASGAS